MRWTDEELVARYRETGAGEAVGELLHRHLPRIQSFVHQMMLDDSACEDVTQEVFLRAFRALDSFNGESRFSTWLYRVAINTTRTWMARESRRPVSFHPHPPERIDHTAATPERAAIYHELEHEVSQALAELSPKLRAAIVLTTMQQLSVAEAAKIEGCSTATIYWRIHEARNILKARLQGHIH